MDAKEYLGQAYRIDRRINSKLNQIAVLRGLATKVTATLGDEPVSGTRNPQRLQFIIDKIMDFETEINADGIQPALGVHASRSGVEKRQENPAKPEGVQLSAVECSKIQPNAQNFAKIHLNARP